MAIKPWVKKAWAFTGLSPPLLMLMVKGSLPPIIALAAYESSSWADTYTSVGYLVAIMSLLSIPIQTRAKFLQSMLMSLILTCLGAACGMFELLCVVMARIHTTHTSDKTFLGSSGGEQVLEYNASASAVAGVFIVILTYIPNLIRAYRPALTLPCVQFSILTLVASVYGPALPSLSVAEALIRRLLIAFLTGFGLATGISLFIFPMTSRAVVEKQMGAILTQMKAIFSTHKSYMNAVVTKDKDGCRDDSKVMAESKKLQGLMVSVGELFNKMKQEISFARKEFAFGKYEPKDFSAIENSLREVMLPMIGLSTFLGMTDTSNLSHPEDLMASVHILQTADWNEMFELSAPSYADLQVALSKGIDHISYVLGLVKTPKSKGSDEEAKGDIRPSPGDVEFSRHLKSEIERWHDHRKAVIQQWSEEKGVLLPAVFWQDHEAIFKARHLATTEIRSKKLQQQLYLQLFAEFVGYSIARAVYRMVLFADEKRSSQHMQRRHFINPGWRRIRKLVLASFQNDSSELNEQSEDSFQMFLGDALKEKRDPEHLPPTNFYERTTDKIRTVSRILSSAQSQFALRVVFCVMSIAIVGLIRQSADFFIAQRGVWSLIMASISMGTNAGIGLWGFALRTGGSIIAMIGSYAVWYIGDGQPAAVIPVLWVWLMICWFFTLRHIRFIMVGLISMVTSVLIVGYELQVIKIGAAFSEELNHQEYFPTYELAPLRVLAVIVGIGAAFFWTYIPYPVTTHATMRRDLGESLQLLAKLYSAVHTTIDIRMHKGIHYTKDKGTPAAKLEKARQKLVHKCGIVLSRLREHTQHSKLEPTFGGKFPQQKYEKLIDKIQKILHYLYLISYAANSFETTAEDQDSSWIQDFRRFTADINITSHQFVSILCQLSASVINSQALPPYLQVPKPRPLSDSITDVAPDILSIEHIHEPSYAAFATLIVTSSLLSDEVSNVVEIVKDLVGEVDFSYEVIQSTQGQK